ncbi:MAG: hypothetical protein KF856_10025 [Cyclobacteriaceae bacterium]|nr:hypothetical protein [Cyclobacteriaceae bacterium]
MNRIDELFKNKLANHPVAPSAEAWQKVEAGLTKKNNAWVWRLAAALVLFVLVSGAWYIRSKNTGLQPELVQQPLPLPQKEIPVVQPEKEKQNLVAETKTTAQPRQKKTSTVIQSETKKEETEKVNPEPAVVIQAEVLITENKTEPTAARKPIVIEFTLDAMPINMTEPAMAVARVADDKSGLQKILEKARDIKNGESELGSLRDAKNELFAFDFRKDKTKRN